MTETPYFLELEKTGNIAKSPVKEAFSQKSNVWLMFKLIFGSNAAQSSIMHTSQFVSVYFLQRAVLVNESTTYIILAVALLIGAPFFQLAGKWSDSIGRKKVIYAGILLAFFSIPVSFYLFALLGNPGRLTIPHEIPISTTLIFTALVLVNTLASALVYGPMGAFVMEYFGGRTRYTSMGFTHNIGNGFIGGATPLVTEFLRNTLAVSVFLTPFVGLIYPMTLIVIALAVGPFIEESGNRR